MRLFWVVCLICGLAGSSVPALAAVATLVADTKSGLILASRNADMPQPPASLAKVMTLYLAFYALDRGVIKMDDALPVSETAARQPKSKLYLKAGQTISVREAIMAMIIKSANDASVVLAEALAPSHAQFADLMTKTAHELGLKNTTFKNANGLHDPAQMSTARDLAVLTMALIEHYPQYYGLFAADSFTFRGREYQSHNAVAQYYKGAEGLKTGFVSAVGYNIISTARRDGSRLVGIVIGQKSPERRDAQVVRLLDTGFKKMGQQRQASHLRPFDSPVKRKAVISVPNVSAFEPDMRGSADKAKRLALTLETRRPVMVASADIGDDNTEQGDTNEAWSVKIGNAFKTKSAALSKARQAARIITDRADKMARAVPHAKSFQAQIAGFHTKEEASDACRRLRARKWSCMPLASAAD
ncbi:MAG: D-alanyl-D-alanine carboxypeptidase [Alphaproteobacteria bacterium]|nr:D-alanyl-D-alanine carboxypeptidase [Alphaproteobacteria bacterium]